MAEAPSTTLPLPPRGARHWPVWLGVGLCMGLARLPWPLQRGFGVIIGWLALRVLRSRREAARTNLALCLPELDEAAREALLHENFRDVGIGLFEFARAWWGDAAPMRQTARIEGLDILGRLQAEGRGVLLVSGHFMTLEMCGRLLCDHVSLAGMYRRHRSPVMEWAVLRGRLGYASALFGHGDTRAIVLDAPEACPRMPRASSRPTRSCALHRFLAGACSDSGR